MSPEKKAPKMPSSPMRSVSAALRNITARMKMNWLTVMTTRNTGSL